MRLDSYFRVISKYNNFYLDKTVVIYGTVIRFISIALWYNNNNYCSYVNAELMMQQNRSF